MSKLAKDVMTTDPQCCTAETPLNDVAKLMVECDCGEIPVIDAAKRLVGVVTDRDIVCRIVAKGKNPSAMTAADCMSQPVVSVHSDTSVDEVLSTMEAKQIRRVPVIDAAGRVCGIIALADVAFSESKSEVGELVREVSRGATTH
ncbi:MAG: CBS domain-containing protein [Vicinamibacterales bacterium]|jgi:CBS domain-containing protein